MKKNLPQKKNTKNVFVNMEQNGKNIETSKYLRRSKRKISKKKKKKNVYNIELINLVINHDTVFSVASKRYISRERK